MHVLLNQHLTALSIRLQARRAAKFVSLFANGWEQQIAHILSLAEKPSELEAAVAELGQTLYTPGTPVADSKDRADSVRGIVNLLGDLKVSAGSCGLFEFERACESAYFRVNDYLRTLG